MICEIDSGLLRGVMRADSYKQKGASGVLANHSVAFCRTAG
jgi:hypothetical protein